MCDHQCTRKIKIIVCQSTPKHTEIYYFPTKNQTLFTISMVLVETGANSFLIHTSCMLVHQQINSIEDAYS
jgi:hypothetical protein